MDRTRLQGWLHNVDRLQALVRKAVRTGVPIARDDIQDLDTTLSGLQAGMQDVLTTIQPTLDLDLMTDPKPKEPGK